MRKIEVDQYVIFRLYGNPCLLKITKTEHRPIRNKYYNPNGTSTASLFEYFDSLYAEGDFIDALDRSVMLEYSGVNFTYNTERYFGGMDEVNINVAAEFPLGTSEEEAQIVFNAYKDKEREQA